MDALKGTVYGARQRYGIAPRRAVDEDVTLIADLQLARAVIEAFRWTTLESLNVFAWNDQLLRGAFLVI